MPDRPRIGLDNPAFRGRLRQPDRSGGQAIRGVDRQVLGPRVTFTPPPPTDLVKIPMRVSELAVGPAAAVTPVPKVHLIVPQPFAKPAHPKLQQSKVLHRRAVKTPYQKPAEQVLPPKSTKLQLGLVAMAVFIFLIGVFVSLSTLQTNHSTKTQVEALSKKAEQSPAQAGAGVPPAENRPTINDVSGYKVVPDLPKIIQIAKLNVYARVKPVSVNAKNELQAPANIFDAGWYDGSARPGDTPGNGATLIDGHVHGPTLPGVFANIKKLVPGDTIQIIRGDNKTYTYSVVKVQNFNATNLDIGTALTSVQPGKAALNLMTCGGKYDTVKGEYEERTVVFAVQT